MIFAIESSQHPHDLITALPIASKRCPLTEHFWSVAAAIGGMQPKCRRFYSATTEGHDKFTKARTFHAAEGCMSG
jgi:hypothetical protein